MSEDRAKFDDVGLHAPDDWSTKSLGELFTLRKERGFTDLPLLSITASGGLVDRDSLERRDTSNSDKSKYLRVCPGDIAYNTMRMWQGVSGLVSKEGIVSPAYTVCAPAKSVHSPYTAQLFKLPELIQTFHRCSQGLVDDTLNLKFENFAPIKVHIPPLPEQQKIATILSSVDDVIEKTRSQIDKLKDLKTGMMQELLTKGIGHTEFKDSPVGRVPKNWILKKFSEVTLKIQDGTHFSPQSKTGSFLYITSKNIQNGKLELDNISFISKEEHDEIYRRCDVSYGDILLTKDGANTGNCAINTLKEPFSLLSSVAFLRCNQDLCFNEYIYQYISSPIFQKKIKDSMTGNAITRLTLSLIKSFLIPLPEISEQREIVKVLSSIDSRVNSVKANLDKLLMLKEALMQDLLTGKVRVKLDTTEVAAA